MNKWLLRILLVLLPIVIVISIAALVFIVVVICTPEWELSRNFPSIRESVAALAAVAMVVATLFLAWATFSVVNSDRQREERDRKERLLNEIIEWAKGLEERIFPPGETKILTNIRELSAVRSNIPIKEETISDLWDLDQTVASMERLSHEIKEGDEYIAKLASGLDKELGTAIDKVINDMKKRQELLSDERFLPHNEIIKESGLVLELVKDKTKPLDNLSLSKTAYQTVLLGRNAGDIIESTRDVAEKAVEFKGRLLKS
jgi:hypothetical protein